MRGVCRAMIQKQTGLQDSFKIDTLLREPVVDMSSGPGTLDFHHNTDSAFKDLRTPEKDGNPLCSAIGASSFSSNVVSGFLNTSLPSQSSMPMARECTNGEFCNQCFDSSSTHIQDNLLNSVRSYDMSAQCVSNLNSVGASGCTRHAGYGMSHQRPWSLLETSPPTAGPPQDIRSSHGLTNIGLKLHNSFMHLDNISNINISNISNISSLASSYSPFSSLYSPVGHQQLGSSLMTSRFDHGVPGPAFPWSSTRGAGFLTSRCPGKYARVSLAWFASFNI